MHARKGKQNTMKMNLKNLKNRSRQMLDILFLRQVYAPQWYL